MPRTSTVNHVQGRHGQGINSPLQIGEIWWQTGRFLDRILQNWSSVAAVCKWGGIPGSPWILFHWYSIPLLRVDFMAVKVLVLIIYSASLYVQINLHTKVDLEFFNRHDLINAPQRGCPGKWAWIRVVFNIDFSLLHSFGDPRRVHKRCQSICITIYCSSKRLNLYFIWEKVI